MTEHNKNQNFKTDEVPCQEISDPAVLSKYPLVSARMITYNHELYIAQAIEGVVKQETEYPFELIIGEDCSTDGTMEIVLEYQKKYPDIIRVITSDKNVGGHKNGYRTSKACRGKYIAFCEGDDYWHHKHKLQKQVDYMENHPECGMLFSDWNVYHNSSSKLIVSYNYNNGFRVPAHFTVEQILDYDEMMPGTCATMVRRNLCEQVIENDPYLHQSGKFLMGDTQLWAEIALNSEVTYLPECLATYRALDESASRTKDQRRYLRFWISNMEMRLYLCDKHKISEHIRRKIESAWCDYSLQLAFLERNSDLAYVIRRKKKRFTWKEWLRYYGAKHLAFFYFYRASVLFINLFRKKTAPWPLNIKRFN